MKKMVVVFVLMLSMIFSIGISVCAYGEHNTISPYYLYTYSAESNLNIVGDTAYCKSVIKGGSAVTQIKAKPHKPLKSSKKNGII